MRVKHSYLPFIVVFMICIVVISLVNQFLTKQQTGREVAINELDKSQKDWFIEKKGQNEQPTFPSYVEEYMTKYKILVIGESEKVLYLTFNCGYEYNNYTMDFLDILKEENLKGAFFVTGGYLRDNPKIINRMVQEGHIVGNHGNTHADLSKLSAEQIRNEISDWEKSYTDITGLNYKDKYFRPASGVYTEQALAIAGGLGYTTAFWSMAYKDWETENQPGKEAAYSEITNNIHGGCIIMLHTVSQSNKEALKEVIVKLKSDGYEFRPLDTFPKPTE